MAFPNAAAHFKPMQKVPSFNKLLCYRREVSGGVWQVGQSNCGLVSTDAVARTHKEQARKLKIHDQEITTVNRGIMQTVRQSTVGNGMANAMKTNLLLLAFIYLLGTSSFAASNPFDDASAAYERGDYALGIKLFRQLAANGHQWAQRRLGLIYAEGKGVPQDYQEAVKWYRLAAAQGNQFAQINLGVMHANGTGVRQDFVRAHMWFSLAAAALSGDAGDKATKNRDGIAAKMTAEQIATAQEMARRCQESGFKNCD